jgi:hypothetical protein
MAIPYQIDNRRRGSNARMGLTKRGTGLKQGEPLPLPLGKKMRD